MSTLALARRSKARARSCAALMASCGLSLPAILMLRSGQQHLNLVFVEPSLQRIRNKPTVYALCIVVQLSNQD